MCYNQCCGSTETEIRHINECEKNNQFMRDFSRAEDSLKIIKELFTSCRLQC